MKIKRKVIVYYQNPSLRHLEDLLGLTSHIPNTLFFKKRTLSEFFLHIRGRKIKNYFLFFGWIHFLLFSNLAWLIIAFYMICGTFSSQKGIRFPMTRIKITNKDFGRLEMGLPVSELNGFELINPKKDGVVLLSNDPESSDFYGTDQNNKLLIDFCHKKKMDFPSGRKWVIVKMNEKSLYSDFVKGIEYFSRVGYFRGLHCKSKVIFSSPEIFNERITTR